MDQGTDRTGSLDLGNGRHGIDLSFGTGNTVGGNDPGTANTIIHNFGLSVLSLPGANTILGNTLTPNDDQVADLVVTPSTQAIAKAPDHGTALHRDLHRDQQRPRHGHRSEAQALAPVGLREWPVTDRRDRDRMGSSQGVVIPLSAIDVQANLGTLGVGASATVTIVAIYATPNVFMTYDATASSDQIELNPPSNHGQFMVGSANPPPPTHLVSATPTIAGRAIGSVLLTVDGLLDPTLASNKANYRRAREGWPLRHARRCELRH